MTLAPSHSYNSFNYSKFLVELKITIHVILQNKSHQKDGKQDKS